MGCIEVKLKKLYKELGGLFSSYHIFSAVRGPDVNLPFTKIVFSARIRYFLFGDEAPGVVRKHALTKEDIECVKVELIKSVKPDLGNKLLEERRATISHYLIHAYQAVVSLLSVVEMEFQEELGIMERLAILSYQFVGGKISEESYEKEVNKIIERLNK